MMKNGNKKVPQIEEVKQDILELVHDCSDEILAVGIFGSLVHGIGFNDKSDIDIFIVPKDEVYKNEPKFIREFEQKWYSKLSTFFYEKYRRSVTVLFYPINSIRKVSTCKTISLASDIIVVYDPTGIISRMFKRICEKAVEAGLERVWSIKQYVWRIKPELVEPGKIIKFSLEDEQF